MKNKIVFVGIDVDSKNFHFAGIFEDTGEVIEGKTRPNAKALSESLIKLKESGYEVRSCYEITYIGFSLHRQLLELGFSCQPIASSLIPMLKGDRVKTDRKDSLKLAEFFMKGLLQPVHVPDERDEQARDLVRAHQFTRLHVKRQKQQIIAACYRLGRDFRQETTHQNYWSKLHRAWLSSLAEKHSSPMVKTHFRLMLRTLHQLEEMIGLYELEIDLLSKSDRYEVAHQALCSYRGLSTILAMKLILELGDVTRFNHPAQLVSYAGLDISEYSSGGHERKGRITRLGNTVIRSALVEACQSARRRPQVHVALKRRRSGTPDELISVADRCMNRLYKKSQNLLERGKPVNKVKVACARELAGFVWESLKKVNELTAAKVSPSMGSQVLVTN